MIEKTPLEAWIKNKTMLKKLGSETLKQWQLEKFKENFAYAKQNAPFYRQLFSGIDVEDIKTLGDINRIPFTFPEDIRQSGAKMVCVRQNDIARIVTLDTSGTSGTPKRIYFTAEDQELTTVFFNIGMSTFTRKHDRVLILLPGLRPGSIGDLLKKALSRMDAEGIIYGIVDDAIKVQELILRENINVIVGIPQQVFGLAMQTKAQTIKEKGSLHSVLLSTDYVPDAVAKRIEARWGCTVYEHYGMTETGLGGGVFCKALRGYHMRDADMFFEIVDPKDGMSVEEGQFGEVVFTTLTRKGMPLIRYRTGDISRFLEAPCSCKTVLKTMDKIQYRIAASVVLKNGYRLKMPALEEILFSIEGVFDFDAVLTNTDDSETLILKISDSTNAQDLDKIVMNALYKTELCGMIEKGELRVLIQSQPEKELDIKAIRKRKIIDERAGKE